MIDYSYIGSEIKIIRKEMGLSQAKLAEKSNVSIDTIRRLENVHTLPRLDSLNDIFRVLGIEFDIVLRYSKGSQWEEVENILSECNNKMEEGNLNDMEAYIKRLTLYNDRLPNFYQKILSQYIFLYKASACRRDLDYYNYKRYLDKAFSIFRDKLDIKNLENNYSDIEIRILEAYSEYYLSQKEMDESKAILNHLLSIVYPNHPTYQTISYNLARYYFISGDYNASIDTSLNALDKAYKYNDYKRLILFNYMIGISKLFLKENDYSTYIEKSLDLCELMNKPILKIKIKENIKDCID